MVDTLSRIFGIVLNPLNTYDQPSKQHHNKMATILEASTSASPPLPAMDSKAHFPLLDLPVELQRLVFYHYFGGSYDITVDSERLTMLRSKFHVIGVPSTNLLCVSKHVHRHAASVRRDTFSGRLILNSVFILIPLGKQVRFEWLRENTTILHFSDSSVHPERWSRYWDSFCRLRRLEICFPKIKEVGMGLDREEDGTARLEDVLAGKLDQVLLGSLDVFRMSLVDQLRDDRLEVMVRQKFCAKRRDGEQPSWDGLVVRPARFFEFRATCADEEIGCEDKVDRKRVRSDRASAHAGVNCEWNGGQSVERSIVRHQISSQSEGILLTAAISVHANGNVLDAGAHRSLWEWHQAMTG